MKMNKTTSGSPAHLTDRCSPLLEQAVVAAFLADGHFGRHVRRMRMLYGERQATLVQAARRNLAGALDVPASETGMHLVGWLPAGADDEAVARAARLHGVETPPLSAFGIDPPRRAGLILGYAPFDERQIQDGVQRLTAAVDE